MGDKDRNRKYDKEKKNIKWSQSDTITLLSNYTLVDLPSDGIVKNMLQNITIIRQIREEKYNFRKQNYHQGRWESELRIQLSFCFDLTE